MTNSLYIAFRSDNSAGQWGPVGLLDRREGLYRFRYTRGAEHLEGFSPFPGMPYLDKVYESEELFPLFKNRLLSKSRPEYDAYLTWGGFDPDNPPEPIAILGVTEGRKQTDRYEVFPCPTPDTDGCFLTRFFLHGLRYMPEAAVDRVKALKQGDRLALMPDVQNPHDPFAVAVRPMDDEDRFMLGYVPRYLARDFSHLCQSCHPDFNEVSVERVNTSAPLQQRLLCRMSACWPEDFRPCNGGFFDLLTPHVPTPVR